MTKNAPCNDHKKAQELQIDKMKELPRELVEKVLWLPELRGAGC